MKNKVICDPINGDVKLIDALRDPEAFGGCGMSKLTLYGLMICAADYIEELEDIIKRVVDSDCGKVVLKYLI